MWQTLHCFPLILLQCVRSVLPSCCQMSHDYFSKLFLLVCFHVWSVLTLMRPHHQETNVKHLILMLTNFILWFRFGTRQHLLYNHYATWTQMKPTKLSLWWIIYSISNKFQGSWRDRSLAKWNGWKPVVAQDVKSQIINGIQWLLKSKYTVKWMEASCWDVKYYFRAAMVSW